MVKYLSLVGLAFLGAGCSLLKASPHRFAVEKKWVRGTLEREYLSGRRMHRFPPLLTENLVITGNAIDGIVAYDRASAYPIWRLAVKDGVEAGAELANGILYFGAGDGQFYAVQPENGQVLWTYPLKAEGIARPLVRGGVVYVLGGNNVAHALNAQTGKLIWVYNRREAGNISVRGGSRPAVAGDFVMFGFSDGSLVALNRTSGAVVWESSLNRNKRFRDVDASPVVEGDTAYVSSYDGALYALNIRDGSILWSLEDGGYGEVLLVGKYIFYSTSSGKTLALDKDSGKVIWSRENPGGIATAPTRYRNVIAVGEMSGALRFLDARTGELLGLFAPGRGVTSQATVDANTGDVYFMSADANLFALHVDWVRSGREWPWE